MRNPNDAGNQFAKNSIIFAIAVLIIIFIFYAYLQFGPRNEAKAPLVPSVPAQEAQITDNMTTSCQAGDVAPKEVNSIANYEIIAGNVTTINAAPTFEGKDLTFAVAAKPSNHKNKIMIDERKGTVRIQAEAKDSFDVTVVAKNACGAASSVFNVQIAEEQ